LSFRARSLASAWRATVPSTYPAPHRMTPVSRSRARLCGGISDADLSGPG
jgi:hypothetical protein